MDTSLEKLYSASKLIENAKWMIRDEVEYDIHREIYAKLKMEEALKIMNDLEEQI